MSGDDVRLEFRLGWDTVGSNGFPEGISRHRVSRERDVAPPACPLEGVGALAVTGVVLGLLAWATGSLHKRRLDVNQTQW